MQRNTKNVPDFLYWPYRRSSAALGKTIVIRQQAAPDWLLPLFAGRNTAKCSFSFGIICD